MKRRRVAINLAVFMTLFAAMLVEATRSIITVGAVTHPYTVKAEFANAFGVIHHSEVTYLGVPFGEVNGVKRIPGGVLVTMQVKHGHGIPVGSTASILRKSALGEQYVDFEPPASYHGNAGPFVRPQSTIGLDHTTVPLEFSELLRSASNLISSVPPAAVASLVHETAVGLNGRTDSLRALADAGDRLSAALAAKTTELDRLATNNTRLTAVVTAHRNSLGQSLTDLRQVADTLAATQGDTNQLLDKGAPFLQQAADLVASVKGELDCDLKLLVPLVDTTTTPRKLQELAALLDYGPRGFAGVWDSRDIEPDGVWVRVGLISNSTNPPTQYSPPKDPPAPPSVPVCSSPLKPVAADYRPAALTGSGGGAIPPLGREVATGGAALLLAGAAVRRRLITRPVVGG